MSTRFRKLALICLCCLMGTAPAQEPSLDAENILFWSPERQIVGYRNIDRLFATRPIRADGLAWPLIPDPADLDDFRYRHEGKRLSIDDYMRQMRTAGLIAIRDGRVRLERYGLGNDAESRWISFSVAKSVTSLLFGAALQDGFIESLDEKVTDYLPRLKGSGYDTVSLADVLRMASGVAWNEDYADPQSDIAVAPQGGLGMLDYLRELPRVAPPGEQFNYNTLETNLAGNILRSAIGNNLATYLEAKIWVPFGMEHDASWLLDRPHGEELGGCCINATLRDYARIGLFALNDGVLPTGERVLPEGFMAESVSPSPGYDGYGYYWWLHAGGAYEAEGVFGQIIYIDPERDIVIAIHSAWGEAWSDAHDAHLRAFIAALADAI